MRFVLVGTPGDRRTHLFASACLERGLPAPTLIPWRTVLLGEPLDLLAGGVLRIDSPGEDAATDALLRGPGDPARVSGGARWYAAFTQGLHRLRAAAAAQRVTLVSEPDEIAVMFDKRRCHTLLDRAGVPVPPALDRAPGDYRELREDMAGRGWNRVFVKPSHGSSASGVVALQTAGTRIKATTSAVPGPDGLLNSLRVRSYETEAEVAALVDALAPEGLHVERWLPKASLGGRALDLRVVVVDGVPTHAVVRTSRHPMTNLHLGGARGDLAAVRSKLGEAGWARALELCAGAAACFPGSLMVGVDLLVGIGWQRLEIGEVNAFGDLLPGLTGLPGSGAEGLDTYNAQVRAFQRRATKTVHA